MVNEQVIYRIDTPDLTQYPSHIETLSLDQWYTIGDLHGNALKLLYFMITIGAVEMSKEDFEEYAQLYITYKAPDKTKFDKLEALLKKATVVPGASIRLGGDSFADRGPGDETMASPVYKFKTQKGILETILSNHDIIYIIHMEEAIYYATHDKNNVEIAFDAQRFIERFNAPISDAALDETNPMEMAQFRFFYCSLLGLRASLNHGIIKPQELVEQYYEYKNTLKIFSYDYPWELNGEPVLYAHAPVSKRNIMAFTGSKEAAPTDSSMVPVIDQIHEMFGKFVQTNNIRILVQGNKPEDTFLFTLLENTDDPLDNDMRQTHGHTPLVFGKRNSLDTGCGKINPEGKYCSGDLTYTKTYKTPELAKKAYAEMGGVSGKNKVTFSGHGKRVSADLVEDNNNNKKQRRDN